MYRTFREGGPGRAHLEPHLAGKARTKALQISKAPVGRGDQRIAVLHTYKNHTDIRRSVMSSTMRKTMTGGKLQQIKVGDQRDVRDTDLVVALHTALRRDDGERIIGRSETGVLLALTQQIVDKSRLACIPVQKFSTVRWRWTTMHQEEHVNAPEEWLPITRTMGSEEWRRGTM